MYTIRFYSFLMHNSPIIDCDQRPSVHPFLYFILTLLNNSTFVFFAKVTLFYQNKKEMSSTFLNFFLTFFQNTCFSLFFKSLYYELKPHFIAFVQFYATILALILRSNHILKPMPSYIGIPLHDADPMPDKYPPNVH